MVAMENFEVPPRSQHIVDALFEELKLYWDGLLLELPVFRRNPTEMRSHAATDQGTGLEDSVLFWPIGQEMLADVARSLLNMRQVDPDTPTAASVSGALQSLSYLEWDFHMAPWRNLLLVPAGED